MGTERTGKKVSDVFPEITTEILDAFHDFEDKMLNLAEHPPGLSDERVVRELMNSGWPPSAQLLAAFRMGRTIGQAAEQQNQLLKEAMSGVFDRLSNLFDGGHETRRESNSMEALKDILRDLNNHRPPGAKVFEGEVGKLRDRMVDAILNGSHFDRKIVCKVAQALYRNKPELFEDSDKVIFEIR